MSIRIIFMTLCFEAIDVQYRKENGRPLVSEEFIDLLWRYFSFANHSVRYDYLEIVLYNFEIDIRGNDVFIPENFNNEWFFTPEKYNKIKNNYLLLNKSEMDINQLFD